MGATVPKAEESPRSTNRFGRRGSKKVLLLVLLVPVLVVVWLPLVTGSSKEVSTMSEDQVAPLPGTTVDAPVSVPAPLAETGGPSLETPAGPPRSVAALRAKVRHATRFAKRGWSGVGEPFAATATENSAAEPIRSTDSAGAFSPTSIVLSDGLSPIAVIGGRLVQPGDRIGAVLVVGIEERKVVFQDGDRVFASELSDPPKAARD